MADGRIEIETTINNSGVTQGLNELQNKLNNVGTKLKDVGKSLTTYVTAPVVGMGLAIVKTGMDFDRQMSKVSAISGATGKDFEKLRNQAKELGSTTSFSATQAAQGMEYLALAGWKTEEIYSAMPGLLNLAAAGALDLGRAADITSDVMSAFGLSADTAGHAADVFAYAQANANTSVEQLGEAMKYAAPMAHTYKWSLEETSAGMMVLANSGIKGSLAGQAFASSLGRLSKPTKQMKEVLAETNMEFFTAEGSLKSLPDLIAELEKGMEGMTDRQKAATLSILFGAEAFKHWAVLVEGGSDQLRELTTNLENADGTAEKMALTMMDNLYGSVVALKSAIEGLAIAFSDVISGAIRKFADFLTELTRKFTALDDGTKKVILTIAGIAAAIGPLMIVLGILISTTGTVISALAGLGGAIGLLTSPVAIVVAAIVGLGAAFMVAYSQSESFRVKVHSVFNAIKSTIEKVLNAVGSLVQSKLKEIKSFWDSNGTQILNAVEKAFNGIKSVVDAVMPAVKFVIEMVWTAIKQIISGALNVIMGLIKTFSGLLTGDFSKMWEGIKQIFKGAIDLIIGWITLSFVGGLRTLLTNLAKSGLQIIKGMWDNIASTVSSLGSKVISTVRGLADDVVRFFTNLYSRAVNIFTQLRTFGASIWNSLSQAIIGVARNIWTSVTTHFGNLLSSVRNTMHNLRSTVTSIWNNVINTFKNINLYQIGRDIIQGLINGIGSMASAVWEKAKSIATGIVDKVKGALSIHSPSRVMIEIGEFVGQGLAIGIANTERDVEKQAEKLADIIVFNNKKIIQLSKYQMSEMNKIAEVALEERYQTFENWLNKQYELEYITLQDEIKLREYAVKQFGFYSEDRRKAELKLRDAKIKLFDDTLKREKEFTSRVESIWKNHYEQLQSAEEDYLKKVKELNDKLIAEEKRLNDEYEKAVADRTKSLYSFVGLFDEVKEKSEVTGQQLLSNLRGQVDTFENWRKGIDKLAKRGIDEDLLIELRNMGPSAASEIQALNSLTDEELNEYVRLWREKNRLAREQAINELTGLKSDTETKIQELRASTAQELESVRAEWQNKFVEISNNTKSELEALAEEMPDMGKDIISKLIDGVNEKAPELVSLAESLGEDFSKALNKGMSKLDYYASGGGSNYVASTALPGSSSNTLVKGDDGKYYTWEEYNKKSQSSSNKSSSSSGKLSNIVKDTVNKIADTAKKVLKFHDGGHVGGNGNLRFDEVMAVLKKGEYVVSDEDVKKIASLSVPSINSLYSGIGYGLNPAITNHASSKVDNSRHSHVTVNAGLGAREIANETEKALNRLAFRMG